MEFGVEWNMLQQFCLAEPTVLFRCAFYGISTWKSKSDTAPDDPITIIQHCKLCCSVLASASSIATLTVTCVGSFFAHLGGPDIPDSIQVVLVISMVVVVAFVLAFVVLVGSVCGGLGVRGGGRRSPSSSSSLLLLLFVLLLLLLLSFNMCCSLW